MNIGERLGEQRVIMVFRGAALLIRVAAAEKARYLLMLIGPPRVLFRRPVKRAGTCDSWRIVQYFQEKL